MLIELHYLPSVPYFSQFLQSGTLILETCEHYQKNSFRNKTQIATAQGRVTLSIPLQKGKNQQQSIKEVRISYSENWQKQHWETIRSSYNRSPFFEHYEAHFHRFYHQEFEYLFDYNKELLDLLLKLWKITDKVALAETKEYFNITDGIGDMRNKLNPKTTPEITQARYPQIFEERTGFLSNLSTIDLLFCLGPKQGLEFLKANV
jgi:hypothetical protein